MIFSEDAILMSLLERYEDDNDIKDAVLSYCNRGAVSSSAAKRDSSSKLVPVVEPTQTKADDAADIDMVISIVV